MASHADQVKQYTCTILEHRKIAESTMLIRLAIPDMADRYAPGQFVMIRLAHCNDPLIGRALAIYDRVRDAKGEWAGIDLAYVVKGKFTTALATCQPGQSVVVWGPLGNRFTDEEVDHLILVAGGVGETPMLGLAKEALGESFQPDRKSGYAKSVTLCYGARTSGLLAGLEDFQQVGIEMRISTDDGSYGKKQLVTQSLIEALESSHGSVRIACCGPEPMMEAVAHIALERQVPCEISLETPMACGIGICFTCVAKIRDTVSHQQKTGEACSPENCDWDYRRTCVEGPVFQAAQIVW